MAATLATDGSTWSSTTSTPTTRARRLPAPAYSANPTTTATATADTAPATSKETSGASAPAQFHSTGWPTGGSGSQIDPICMARLISAERTLLAQIGDLRTWRGPASITERHPTAGPAYS